MKMLTKNFTLILGIAMAIVACAQTKEKAEDAEELMMESTVLEETETYQSITTDMISTSGSNLKGAITFSSTEKGTIDLMVELSGVTPGQHAVHIHEKGDCSALDGTSAGGHWNPLNVSHGNRFADEEFHKGDIGNITIGNDSTGTLSMEIEGWTIGGDSTSNILNKAVIVHAGPDDFTSQPSGAAGPRIGCGAIKK